MVNHKFTDKMIALKIPHKLLELACHDTQFGVQESALNALNSLCKHEKARKCLNDLDAIEKLSSISFMSAQSKDLDKETYQKASSLCKNIIKCLKNN